MFDDDGLDDVVAGLIVGVALAAAFILIVAIARVAARFAEYLFKLGRAHAARRRERLREIERARAEAEFEELEVLDAPIKLKKAA